LVGLGTSVILAEDFKKPAWGAIRLHTTLRVARTAYIEFVSVNILQINCSRVLSWVFIIDIADSVGGQVDLAVLMVRDLELPTGSW
jgi:hypothetical protein